MTAIHMYADRMVISVVAGGRRSELDLKPTKTFRLRLPSDTLTTVQVQVFHGEKLVDEQSRSFIACELAPVNQPNDRLVILSTEATT